MPMGRTWYLSVFLRFTLTHLPNLLQCFHGKPYLLGTFSTCSHVQRHPWRQIRRITSNIAVRQCKERTTTSVESYMYWTPTYPKVTHNTLTSFDYVRYDCGNRMVLSGITHCRIRGEPMSIPSTTIRCPTTEAPDTFQIIGISKEWIFNSIFSTIK